MFSSFVNAAFSAANYLGVVPTLKMKVDVDPNTKCMTPDCPYLVNQNPDYPYDKRFCCLKCGLYGLAKLQGCPEEAEAKGIKADENGQCHGAMWCDKVEAPPDAPNQMTDWVVKES